MGGEPNQAFWRGIRPTDPAENIPVDIKGMTGNMPVDIKVCSVTLPVGIQSMVGNMPVDVKVHTVQTPVDIKAHTVSTPIIPATPPQNIPVEVKSVTGNLPVDVKAHTVNTPVDVKSHDVDTPVKDSWVAQGSVDVNAGNPVNGDIHLDTGQLVAGSYDVRLTLSTSVTHYQLVLEHRNAANTAVLHNTRLMTCTYRPVMLYIKNWYVAANERFRVRQGGDLAGTVCGSLWWTRRV